MSARAKAGAKGSARGAAQAAPAVDPKEEKLKQEFEFGSDDVKMMRAEIRSMRADIENETRLLNDFQQQKAKLEEFHDLSKAKRDELKMTLRNALRQKQDLEEKQSYELKIYKQKVKNLLAEHQAGLTDVRFLGEKELANDQTQHRGQQHEIQVETRDIKRTIKEKELNHLELIKNLKVEQEKNIMALRMEYERKCEELKAHYEKKMKVVREEYDEKRKEEVARIELKKNTHIADLMAKHKKKFDKIKKYYSDITHANLELIKNLKEEVGDMKKKEAAVQKEVLDIRRINKKLSRPLQKNKKLIEELKVDLLQYRADLFELKSVNEQLSLLTHQLKNVEWEAEVLEQKSSHLKEERDLMKDKLEKTIFQVQQKSGFKNLLLEKKITSLAQDLEKTSAALSEVLASTNLHPDVIGDIQNNLEDVLMMKNKIIQQQEDTLEEIKRRYARTVQMYEAKLAEYQIPVEELGFTATRKL